MPDTVDKSKILLVDDEVSILKAFKLNLGRTYDLRTAESGREALRLIEEDGPFEVIVSDFAMPGLNGAEFLEKVREQDKEVVTILLTGQANFDDLCEVVRRGEIFRLLGKPCPPDLLAKNLEHAIRQYRLVRSEKELLEQTLNGTLSVFNSLLAASRPMVASRANRVETLAKEITALLMLPGSWRLCIAAKFSYLGYLTLPDDAQEQVLAGKELDPDLRKIVDRLPAFVSDLLKEIPRMKRVCRIIELIDSDYLPGIPEDREERELASVIRLARDYESMDRMGRSKSEIFTSLHGDESRYLPGSLDALAKSLELGGKFGESRLYPLLELMPGMKLVTDLHFPDGNLLAPSGTPVSLPLIQKIKSLAKLGRKNSQLPEVEVVD